MRKTTLISGLILTVLATPALADSHGDASKGEADFKKCKACHAVIADDGTVIQKGGKTGPNLYGVIGRQIGAYPDFKYGDSIVAAGAGGTVWTEEMLADYVADPTAWLKKTLSDPAAKSKMSVKLPKGGADMAAYLASVKPAQ